jgi:hypothetical protein
MNLAGLWALRQSAFAQQSKDVRRVTPPTVSFSPPGCLPVSSADGTCSRGSPPRNPVIDARHHCGYNYRFPEDPMPREMLDIPSLGQRRNVADENDFRCIGCDSEQDPSLRKSGPKRQKPLLNVRIAYVDGNILRSNCASSSPARLAASFQWSSM